MLAYIRQLGEDQVLIANHLSSSAQTAERDFGRFKRCILMEMLGGNIFPRVSDSLYFSAAGALPVLLVPTTPTLV